MTGRGRQTGKLKTASPKTAPGLSTKNLTDGKQDKGGSKAAEAGGSNSKGSEDVNVDQEKEEKFVCLGGVETTCNKEIKGDTCTCCDVCSRWYHMLCQLKSVNEFDAIRNHGLFWVCSHCQLFITALFKRTGMPLIEQVTGSLTEFKSLLVDQAGAVAGVASSSKDLCRIQEEAYNDLKRQLDEQASLIKVSHMSCEEQTKIVSDAVTRIKEKVEHQANRAAEIASADQEQHRSYAEAVKTLGARIEVLSAGEPKTTTEPVAGAALVKSVGNFFDKEKRKYNNVVHNLPENGNQDVKARTEDIEDFKNLIKDEFHISGNISKARALNTGYSKVFFWYTRIILELY